MTTIRTWLRTRWNALDLFFRILAPLVVLGGVASLIGQHWLSGVSALATAYILVDWQYWQHRAGVAAPFASLGHATSKAIFAAIERGEDHVIVHIEADGDEKNWRVEV